MEHRDADFNILLATDSYKVNVGLTRAGFQTEGGRWRRAAADG